MIGHETFRFTLLGIGIGHRRKMSFSTFTRAGAFESPLQIRIPKIRYPALEQGSKFIFEKWPGYMPVVCVCPCILRCALPPLVLFIVCYIWYDRKKTRETPAFVKLESSSHVVHCVTLTLSLCDMHTGSHAQQYPEAEQSSSLFLKNILFIHNVTSPHARPDTPTGV